MTGDRSCKRCSVARVNALSKAYQLAQQNGAGQVRQGLRALIELVRRRGYDPAQRLLVPGLGQRALRELSWNVSSFLEDQEVDYHLGHLVD